MISTAESQEKLKELITQHIAPALDKQFYLADLIGEEDWWVNYEKATISFGDKLTFKIQVLGTESNLTNTWQWFWANTQSFSPELVKASLQMRSYGEQSSIPEFVEPLIPMDPLADDGSFKKNQTYFDPFTMSNELDGHYFSTIALGICNADAYFRAPYGDRGASFVLINYPQLRQIPESLARVATLFPQFIMNMPFEITSHRQAFVPYLQYYNVKVQETVNEVVGIDQNNRRIVGQFDQLGRLTDLSFQS